MIHRNKIFRFFGALVLWLGIVVARLCFDSCIVWAEEEKIYFGSESYEWEIGEETPIGIHVSSDSKISSFHYIVKYNPEILQYVSGGIVLSENEIEVTVSDVGDTHYLIYLYFMPVGRGDTSIDVQDIRMNEQGGESYALEQISAPVHVLTDSSGILSDIKVNGKSIPAFQSDKFEYTIYIEPDESETVTIETMPAEVTTDIPDIHLKEGNNDVEIICTDKNEKQVIYLLHIYKPPIKENESIYESEQNVQESAENGSLLSHSSQRLFILGMILLVLVILFVILIIEKIRLIQKRKRWERRKERKRTETIKNKEPIDIVPDQSCRNTKDKKIEIGVYHITMDFKREKDESSSIKETVIRILKRQRQIVSFRALDDVSFEVEQGEVVGIIGTNGSGKSTILKIISGVLIPTQGEVKVNKKKVQLLTLGTGFDMELTGRENIYLNGAIIGYTKEYIDEKYDEIVKFAELDGFMEERVKNYSSGMVSRLGFAIATCRETPEILILDEVLSVGDMFFRKKSEARIQQMIHGGSTVLIVSHSTSVIRKNCTKVVWIERGKLRAVGDPEEVCNAYEAMNG